MRATNLACLLDPQRRTVWMSMKFRPSPQIEKRNMKEPQRKVLRLAIEGGPRSVFAARIEPRFQDWVLAG